MSHPTTTSTGTRNPKIVDIWFDVMRSESHLPRGCKPFGYIHAKPIDVWDNIRCIRQNRRKKTIKNVPLMTSNASRSVSCAFCFGILYDEPERNHRRFQNSKTIGNLYTGKKMVFMYMFILWLRKNLMNIVLLSLNNFYSSHCFMFTEKNECKQKLLNWNLKDKNRST